MVIMRCIPHSGPNRCLPDSYVRLQSLRSKCNALLGQNLLLLHVYLRKASQPGNGLTEDLSTRIEARDRLAKTDPSRASCFALHIVF